MASKRRGSTRGRGLGLAGLALFCALLAPLLWPDSTEGKDVLTIFAAASTAGVVSDITGAFKPIGVRNIFGPSSGLARQVRDGAPADVFISASGQWVDFLVQEGCVRGEPRLFCRSRLVVIAPQGSSLRDHSSMDLARWFESLPPGEGLAVANEGVPVGDYARQVLRNLGLAESGSLRLVGQADARATLRAVESGQLEVGIVYATDTIGSEVEVLFTIDAALHESIEYFAVEVARPGDEVHDHARAFLDHLGEEEVQRVLSEAGFQLP